MSLTQLLNDNVLHPRVAPAASAGFAGRGQLEQAHVGGTTPLSLYDLASITKTLTALTAARRIEGGALSWTTTVAELLPQLADTPGGRASIEEHLSHRAGMAAHRELFLGRGTGAPLNREKALAQVARCAQSGELRRPLYSDLGYILVGEALSREAGCALDQLVERELLSPFNLAIGSSRQWQQRLDGCVDSFVCTEIEPRRGGLIQAAVHDDNAWALSGYGSCGHAGLFGTLKGVLDLGLLLLKAHRGDGPLAQAAEKLFLRRPGGSLRLGLDGVSGKLSTAGSLAGSETFGHLGFTGTSFWCDPARSSVTAFLCNRVHPTRVNPGIRIARPRLHDGLWAASDRGLDA